ncbi:MAG TPA: hypothetical protein VLZ06_11585 [Solirubrobacteraceae bacterium]|nr:hypothetical protein [Solirubrobacteraceae bacterium]
MAGLVCVAMAATASAREGGASHEFVGNVSSEIGLFTSEQELDLAPIVIHCKGVKPARTGKKTVFPALKILVVAKLIKCKTVAFKANNVSFAASKATVGEPLEIEYRAGGEPNATIDNSSPVRITFAGALEGCVVSLSPTDPTNEVTYTNSEVKAKNVKYFPTGVQHVVSIANGFEKVTYTMGGGPCERLHRTQGKEGEWFGTLIAGLKTGNLSWE